MRIYYCKGQNAILYFVIILKMKKDVKEVEVKVKIEDFKSVRSRLEGFGCVFSEVILQEDVVYIPRGIDFTQVGTVENVLRIRTQNDKSIFTLKRKDVDSLVKIERETVIDNPSQLEDILEYLGYAEVSRVKKERVKTKYKDMEICLDRVEQLGSFVECEMITSSDPIEAQGKMLNFLEEIGVDVSARAYLGYDILVYIAQNPGSEKYFAR